MAKHKISIARDFTRTPGARYYADGPFSGQEFREKILEKAFNNTENSEIEVDLSGTDGYPTSFLEEAFGGLVRKHGLIAVKSRMTFICNDDPFIIPEIEEYMNAAEQ